MDNPYLISKFFDRAPLRSQLVSFLRNLFGEYTNSKWEWEFNDSCIVIAENNGQIVGHYGALKMPFYLNGVLLYGAKAEGSLIDFNYVRKLPRGKTRDIFSQMVRFYLDISESEQIDFTFGFPNSSAIAGQIKAGYSLLEVPIKLRTFLVSTFFILEKILRNKFAAGLISRVLDGFLRALFMPQRGLDTLSSISEMDRQGLEAFSKKLSLDFPEIILQGKSWEYISWRFLSNPYTKSNIFTLRDNHGAIEGIVIGSVEERSLNYKVGSVQDFICLKDVSLMRQKLLLNGITKWLSDEGVGYIEFWESPGFPNKEILPWLSLLGYFHFGKLLNRKMILHSRVNIPKNLSSWYVTRSFKRY